MAYDPAKHPKDRLGRWAKKSIGDVAKAHPKVDLTASEGPDGIVLSMIRTVGAYRGKGYASKALRDLVDYADAKGKPIALTPEPLNLPGQRRGLSKTALTALYKRHGFVANRGRRRNFRFRESMIRPAAGG